MQILLAGLFTQSFIPHGHCYLWQPGLVGLHLVSDLLIAIAYYSIPLVLIHFVQQRRDVPYSWMFLLFSAFIVACGTTHLIEVWTLWHPIYWLSGTLKAITAIVSLSTAVLLVPLVPKALALPSPAQLEAANRELQREIVERKKAEAALQKARDELEVHVAERTSELVNAYEELKASEEKFQQLAENIREAFFIQSFDLSQFLYISPGYERIWGRSCESLYQNPAAWIESLHPEDQDSVRVSLQKQPQGEPFNQEYRIIQPNGAVRWVFCRTSLVQNETGEFYRIVGLAEDITDRKQAEIALQQLNADLEQRVADRTAELTQMNDRFQAFMNYSPASTWIADTEGQILYVNQTYLRTFQLPTTDIVGKSVFDLYDVEVAQPILDSIRTVVETQQVVEVIEVIPHQNGTLGEFLVYNFPIPGQFEQTWVGGVALDITDRRALEREVLQKQQILEDFIICSPVGMTLLDQELRYVVINEALAEVNGVPVAAHIGKTPWDIVPDVAANLEEVFQRVLTTGESILSIEVSGETPKAPGVEQDWLASYFPIRSEDNQSLGLGIVAVDITARKRAELENQMLKERLQFVLSFNPAVIFACKPSGNYDSTFVSSNIQSILGYTPEEFVTNSGFWANRIHPEDAPQIFEALPQLSEQGHHVHEYRFLHQNGSYRWLRNELQLVQDGQGVPIEIVGYLADISDRKQAEQQLELQDTIVKNMAEGICLVREADGTIVYANPKFEQMFGYETGELIDQVVSVLNYESETINAEATTRLILSNINTYGVYSYEVYSVKKDGMPFWCRATTSRFEHPEYGVVYVAVQADISDLKRVEAEARASLQIKAALVEKEASLKEKEVLLQEIHHRVKNNLQIVDGLLQMQSRRTENRQASAVLLESQHRIKSIALVHEKLYRSDDLAKINFSEYVRSLVSSLFDSYQASSSSITLVLKVEEIALDIDTAIPCGLIINELVSNALKYAFPEEYLQRNGAAGRGEIQLELCAQDETELMLSVGDNGTGIPEHIDLNKTQSLGLKLVRGLATQLEGTVEINRDQGTLVKVTFPSGKS